MGPCPPPAGAQGPQAGRQRDAHGNSGKGEAIGAPARRHSGVQDNQVLLQVGEDQHKRERPEARMEEVRPWSSGWSMRARSY